MCRSRYWTASVFGGFWPPTVSRKARRAMASQKASLDSSLSGRPLWALLKAPIKTPRGCRGNAGLWTTRAWALRHYLHPRWQVTRQVVATVAPERRQYPTREVRAWSSRRGRTSESVRVRLWHLCTLGGQSARHYVPEEQHVLSVCDHAGGAAKMQCHRCGGLRAPALASPARSTTCARVWHWQYVHGRCNTPPPTGAAYSAGAVATHDSASLARRSRPLFLQELVAMYSTTIVLRTRQGLVAMNSTTGARAAVTTWAGVVYSTTSAGAATTPWAGVMPSITGAGTATWCTPHQAEALW